MKLGKYFTLEELTASSHKEINNSATPDVKVALTNLVKNVLDPARDDLNDQIHINSGYRCPILNRAVGGAATSQHVKGEAADLTCTDNAKLFKIIRDNLVFDQLIWEAGDDRQPAWVHVSYKTQGNRGEVLRMKNGKYTRI